MHPNPHSTIIRPHPSPSEPLPLHKPGYPKHVSVNHRQYETVCPLQMPTRPDPLIVKHLGDLMSHMGVWIVLLLVAQGWLAWNFGQLLSEYLLGGPYLYSAISFLMIFLVDIMVWLNRKGNLIDAFLIPFAVLAAITGAPLAILIVK